MFGKIIDEVSTAISATLKDEFKTFKKSDWLNVSNAFNAKWNFPNCIGAIDGKHVAIKRPKGAGSLFYNYKVTFTTHI